jgi:hypothetical protein
MGWPLYVSMPSSGSKLFSSLAFCDKRAPFDVIAKGDDMPNSICLRSFLLSRTSFVCSSVNPAHDHFSASARSASKASFSGTAFSKSALVFHWSPPNRLGSGSAMAFIIRGMLGISTSPGGRLGLAASCISSASP